MQIGLVGSGNMARALATSPGGNTARGLAALERGGVRATLAQAMDDVVDFT
jgi:pyrroline-5-carboxylate reductase